MKKTLAILLLSINTQAQTIQEMRIATRIMENNLKRMDIIASQDSLLDYCDTAKAELKSKLKQSETINLIHKSVESGQAKVIAETSGKLEKETKRKKAWRKVGVFAIIENVVIGIAVFLTVKGF
mgnify:CR=1 FL=1